MTDRLPTRLPACQAARPSARLSACPVGVAGNVDDVGRRADTLRADTQQTGYKPYPSKIRRESDGRQVWLHFTGTRQSSNPPHNEIPILPNSYMYYRTNQPTDRPINLSMYPSVYLVHTFLPISGEEAIFHRSRCHPPRY